MVRVNTTTCRLNSSVSEIKICRFILSFVYAESCTIAYEFMVCLVVFVDGVTVAGRRLGPPPVSHIKIEVYRQEPHLQAQKANLPAFSPHYHFRAELYAEKLRIGF